MTAWAYYNEFDPYVAKWLRNLIAAGHIPPGFVDERSIEDVLPNDLLGFTQCHFFAGIGVWPYALRRAGWPDDRPVWTASCPCQPFSAAGKGDGFANERHLWPAFHHLAAIRRPGIILGEQVASPDAAIWLDLVHTDLEALGYAFGAVAFPSAGVGAPHIRDRTYWVADSDHAGLEGRIVLPERSDKQSFGSSGLVSSPGWVDAEWLPGIDGKFRPVEPGTFPLAHGAASRVGRLRAYGNAINAEAAIAFIKSTM